MERKELLVKNKIKLEILSKQQRKWANFLMGSSFYSLAESNYHMNQLNQN